MVVSMDIREDYCFSHHTKPERDGLNTRFPALEFPFEFPPPPPSFYFPVKLSQALKIHSLFP